jgi:dethiobiotin synthetase
MAAFFITGTDTGVGKTFVTAALLDAAGARGLKSIGIKPLAAGTALQAGRQVNDDALVLQSCATVKLDYEEINPVALRLAMAPHLAAAAEGRLLEAHMLAEHCRRIAAIPHDLLLAEGAGGWLVPLNERETMADVAAALGWPVILVVGMRLGCLNHALLSAAAIDHAGLALGGWVANCAWPDMPGLQANIATLEARLPAPRLASLPWLGAAATVADAAAYFEPWPLPGAAGG